MGRGMRDSAPPMGKLPMLRCVWAPHREPAGISSEPKLSLSLRAGRSLAGSNADDMVRYCNCNPDKRRMLDDLVVACRVRLSDSMVCLHLLFVDVGCHFKSSVLKFVVG